MNNATITALPVCLFIWVLCPISTGISEPSSKWEHGWCQVRHKEVSIKKQGKNGQDVSQHIENNIRFNPEDPKRRILFHGLFPRCFYYRDISAYISEIGRGFHSRELLTNYRKAISKRNKCYSKHIYRAVRKVVDKRDSASIDVLITSS